MRSDKVGILSLGCPRNLVDSETILSRLHDKGYLITDIDKADIGIINTCAFIEEAKKESIEAILSAIELKKTGALKKIIVCGCLAQRYKTGLCAQLPEIDAFVGVQSLDRGISRFPIVGPRYAYIKVSEGCANRCSFCVIPYIKKGYVSLTIKEVVNKVKDLEQKGISEIILIGQDISHYGIDRYGKKKLPGLIENVLKAAGKKTWIRLLYLYPDPVINDILDLIKGDDRLCKYIDLPIQHINDRILRMMNRNTTRAQISGLIENIRNKLSQAAIRTSVITGFPSETKKEFVELLNFIKDVKFDRLGAFIYSREEGTAAYAFGRQISKKEKIRRFDAIMTEQKSIAEGVNRAMIGKKVGVIIEGRVEGQTCGQEKETYSFTGRTQFDAPEVDGMVYIKGPKRPGNKGIYIPKDVSNVLITGVSEYDLIGELT